MRALVLSGGGSKGAFQVGALKRWMFEEGIDYDLIAGISVGAINAATLCQVVKGRPAIAWDLLHGFWSDVTTAKIRKPWMPTGMLSALWKSSAYNSAPLQSMLKRNIDAQRTRACGRALRVVAVSWDTGESRVIDETDPEIASWVIASSAFPGMLCPITIDGQRWADGGLRSVTPLGEAIRAGATDIDVILCSDPDLPNPYLGKPKVLPDLALRALDLLTNELMRADLKICGLKNDLAGPYRVVNLRVVKPSVHLEAIQGSLDFSQPGVQRFIQLGYEAACNAFV